MKLLDQVRNVIIRKHYSIRTEQAYFSWIKNYIGYHRLVYLFPAPEKPRLRDAWVMCLVLPALPIYTKIHIHKFISFQV